MSLWFFVLKRRIIRLLASYGYTKYEKAIAQAELQQQKSTILYTYNEVKKLPMGEEKAQLISVGVNAGIIMPLRSQTILARKWKKDLEEKLIKICRLAFL
jgi:hypothetical protein